MQSSEFTVRSLQTKDPTRFHATYKISPRNFSSSLRFLQSSCCVVFCHFPSPNRLHAIYLLALDLLTFLHSELLDKYPEIAGKATKLTIGNSYLFPEPMIITSSEKAANVIIQKLDGVIANHLSLEFDSPFEVIFEVQNAVY